LSLDEADPRARRLAIRSLCVLTKIELVRYDSAVGEILAPDLTLLIEISGREPDPVVNTIGRFDWNSQGLKTGVEGLKVALHRATRIAFAPSQES
jgi:hypothetical protein